MIRIMSAAALISFTALAGCGSEPAPAPPEVPDMETISDDPSAALAADPERLREIRRECRIDRAAAGAALCEAAARATRMRFMGDDIPAYEPAPEDSDANAAWID
jgi:outer membrane murein-binding lipoprotein Lpp